MGKTDRFWHWFLVFTGAVMQIAAVWTGFSLGATWGVALSAVAFNTWTVAALVRSVRAHDRTLDAHGRTLDAHGRTIEVTTREQAAVCILATAAICRRGAVEAEASGKLSLDVVRELREAADKTERAIDVETLRRIVVGRGRA